MTPSQPLYKFGHVPRPGEPGVAHHYGNTFSVEEIATGSRIVLAPSGDAAPLFTALMQTLPEPLGLLYVLVAARVVGEGRYQSAEPVSREQALQFLGEFEEFFERDGRHSLWITSLAASALLVWDRHGLLYGYSSAERVTEWAQMATAAGLTRVSPEEITIPSPHAHHFHPQFDPQEQAILAQRRWNHSPLQPQDK